MKITLNTRATDAPKPAWLRHRLRKVCAELKLKKEDVTVVVIEDRAMAQLHEKFSGVEGTTDVLTFDLSDGDHSFPEGEIYVCINEARRKAVELGHELKLELLLYSVHGLLHLLGYDDHRAADHRRMHAKEDELLEAIGVGPVYRLRKPARLKRRATK